MIINGKKVEVVKEDVVESVEGMNQTLIDADRLVEQVKEIIEKEKER